MGFIGAVVVLVQRGEMITDRLLVSEQGQELGKNYGTGKTNKTRTLVP